jgi:FKBP-type peptidyl-prolyl cis-trans isomerase FklB
MKVRFQEMLMLAVLMAFSAGAEEPAPATAGLVPPDPEKVSYALGMNLGLQIKRMGADVDVNVLAQALKDVLDGKPTKVRESEMRPIFAQEQAYEVAKKKAAGEAFLAKNARMPGVVVLPDGLQYRVVEAGAGEVSKTNEPLVINFRGTWIDGREFRRKEHIQVMPITCPKGMREALLMMKPGSKWRVFVPSDLAYGQQAGRAAGFGSTLIYDLELVSVGTEAAHAAELYGGGRLGHSSGEDFLPAYSSDSDSDAGAVDPLEQTRGKSNVIFPGDSDK